MNVQRPRCGVLEWDAPAGSTEGLTYKIRLYTGPSFAQTPSSSRRIISSPTNSLTFTSQEIPQLQAGRSLFAIVSYLEHVKRAGFASVGWFLDSIFALIS